MARVAVKTARYLGYGGLIPFIALALLTAFGPTGWHHNALIALVAYAALILSFLGGITWGIAVRDDHPDRRLYLLSMVPFFLAWAALLIPEWLGVWVLIVAFLVALANDYVVGRLSLSPSWFRTLRTVLTAVVILCLTLAALTL